MDSSDDQGVDNTIIAKTGDTIDLTYRPDAGGVLHFRTAQIDDGKGNIVDVPVAGDHAEFKMPAGHNTLELTFDQGAREGGTMVYTVNNGAEIELFTTGDINLVPGNFDLVGNG